MVIEKVKKTEHPMGELSKSVLKSLTHFSKTAEIASNPSRTMLTLFKPNKKKLTLGQRAADVLTKWAGSWTFIILVGTFIAIWIYFNLTAYVKQWDPWPFIILNLCLSCLAAMQAPIILMSQNREEQRDRQRVEYDYQVNRRAEREIREIKTQLGRIEKRLKR